MFSKRQRECSNGTNVNERYQKIINNLLLLFRKTGIFGHAAEFWFNWLNLMCEFTGKSTTKETSIQLFVYQILTPLLVPLTMCIVLQANELKCKTKNHGKTNKTEEKKLWKQTIIALLILISIVEFRICIWKYKTQLSCNNILSNTVYYENEQISNVFRNQSKWLGFVRTKKNEKQLSQMRR